LSNRSRCSVQNFLAAVDGFVALAIVVETEQAPALEDQPDYILHWSIQSALRRHSALRKCFGLHYIRSDYHPMSIRREPGVRAGRLRWR
jgi:hypothetical protein